MKIKRFTIFFCVFKVWKALSFTFLLKNKPVYNVWWSAVNVCGDMRDCEISDQLVCLPAHGAV